MGDGTLRTGAREPASDGAARAQALAPGAEVGGRFRLRRRLGRGLSGESWIAHDSRRDDRCVIKVCGDPGEARGDWVSLRAEARRLRGVSHPNLARFRAAVFEPETPLAAVATEFAAGPTVFEAAQRGERPRDEAVGLLVGCARGLAALHAADIVHRDLQPRNVVLVGPTREPSAVLIDLGLAAIRPATPRGALVGTLGFTAPEVVLDGRADARSDLYSLGAVLFYLLTGEPPVDPTRVLGAIVRGEDPYEQAARRAREVLPEPFASLASRLLARHPHARFQDAAEVIAAVNRAFRASFAVESAEVRRPAVARAAFVGRVADVRRTARHLKRNLEAGAAVVVRAAPGVGRTRFLEEVLRPLVFRGARVAEIRPGGPDDAPLAPILAALRGVRHRLPADAQALIDRARALLDAGGGDGAPPAARAALLLREALADASAAAPLVLCVDDGDGLDAFSLDLVRRCAEASRAGSAGPTILAAFREGTEPPPVPTRLAVRALAEHPRSLNVALRPLSRPATESLVRGLLPLPGLSRGLLDRVWSLAGGVPRSVVDLVESLLGDALVHRPGGWTLVIRGRDLPVPPSLLAAAAARLAPLAPEQKDSLLALAILGVPAGRASWAAVRRASGLPAGAEDDLLRRGVLARNDRDGTVEVPTEALRRHLLEECPRSRLRRWAGVLADSVPGHTALAVRLRLDAARGESALREGEAVLRTLRHHRRLDEGLSLATLLADEARRRPGPEAAGVLDEAAFLAVAADRFDLAAKFVEQGLRKSEAGPDRRRLLVRLCEVKAFAREDPAEAVAACREEALGPDERARVLFAEARHRAQCDDWSGSRALLDQAMAESGVTIETEARLRNAVAAVHAEVGRLDDSVREYGRAARLFEEAGSEPGLALVANNLANLEVRRGRFRHAVRMLEDAARGLGAHVTAGEEVALLLRETGAFESLGRWSRAADCAARACALAEEMGVRHLESNALGRLGHAEACLGRFESGIRGLTRSIRISRKNGLQKQLSAARLFLAQVHLDRGDREAALRALRGGRDSDLEVRTMRLLCASERLPPTDALAAVRALLADPGFTALPEERASLQREEALLLLRGGMRGEAAAALREIVRTARRAGAADDHLRALIALHGCVEAGSAEATRTRRGIARLAPRIQHVVLRAEALELLARTEPDPGESRRLALEAGALFERASLPSRAPRTDRGAAAEASGVSVRGLGPDRLRWVLDNTARVNSAEDPGAVLAALLDAALSLTGAERGFLVLAKDDGYEVREARSLGEEEVEDRENSLSASLVRTALGEKRSLTTTNAAEDPRFARYFSVREMQLRSVLVVPIRRGERAIGAFYLDNRFVEGAFKDEDRLALELLAEQAALAFENLSYRERIGVLNARLKERLSLRERQLDEMKSSVRSLGRATKYAYRGILRQGGPMEETLRLVDRAVDSGIPVLVEGESGTGKELVAKALHLYGPRASRPFVVVNCAALPPSLIESELFGHRRGAFTGAHADRPGQFEAADGGTLFLDEIGELPLAVQPKILRAVQFGEFVPLGSTARRKADVRLVCATNRTLRSMVARGEFREDLYYRLAVFPIRIPPLRERKQDIPLLAEFLVRRIAREMGRGPRRLHRRAVARLLEHDWPGNVRELENVLRRAVLVAPGNILAREDLPIEPLAPGEHAGRLQNIARGVPGGIAPRERTLLLRVLEQGCVSMREFLAGAGVSRSTTLRDLRRLVRERVLTRKGRTTAAYYGLDARWDADARLTQA